MREALKPGTKLLTRDGVYELQGLLGEGGTGLVYLCARQNGAAAYCVKEFFPVEHYERRNGLAMRKANGEDLGSLRACMKREFEISKILYAAGEEAPQMLALTDCLTVKEIVEPGEKGNTYSLGRAEGYFYLMQRTKRFKTLRQLVVELEELEKMPGQDQDVFAMELEMFSRMVQAVRLLHKRYVHLDLSPDNIGFQNSDLPAGDVGTACLIDFGSAREIGEAMPEEIYATPEFAAPEIMRVKKASVLLDIFALGKLFRYILLMGEEKMGSASYSKAYFERYRRCEMVRKRGFESCYKHVNHVLSGMLAKETDREKIYPDLQRVLRDLVWVSTPAPDESGGKRKKVYVGTYRGDALPSGTEKYMYETVSVDYVYEPASGGMKWICTYKKYELVPE